MEKIGFAREDRAFSPHLTLARFQVPRPQPALEAASPPRARLRWENLRPRNFSCLKVNYYRKARSTGR